MGSPSSVVEDLSVYMSTLKKLDSLHLDYILLPHSMGLEMSQVMVPAKPKIKAYI